MFLFFKHFTLPLCTYLKYYITISRIIFLFIEIFYFIKFTCLQTFSLTFNDTRLSVVFFKNSETQLILKAIRVETGNEFFKFPVKGFSSVGSTQGIGNHFSTTVAVLCWS